MLKWENEERINERVTNSINLLGNYNNKTNFEPNKVHSPSPLLYDILVGNCELKSAYDDPSFLGTLPFCHLET